MALVNYLFIAFVAIGGISAMVLQQQQQQQRAPRLLLGQCSMVNCFVEPCRTASCPAYPNATCVNNYCNGCNAKFYMNGAEINCTSGQPVDRQVANTGRGVQGRPFNPIRVPTIPQLPRFMDRCPKDDNANVQCFAPGQNYCDNCRAKGQVCCSDGCDQICKKPRPSFFPIPVIPRPNIEPITVAPTKDPRCPNTTNMIGICIDSCIDCGFGGQICCSNGCGRVCMDPVY